MSRKKEETVVSKVSRLSLLIHCMTFGWMGGHRFYAGKDRTGLLMMFTGGGLGMLWAYDFAMIAAGKFTDGKDLPVKVWALPSLGNIRPFSLKRES